MPHPYVDSVKLSNNQVTLSVEVTDFGPSGGYVEVSGQASQVGGALAIISQTVEVPAKPNGEGDDENSYFVDVTAAVISSKQFRIDQNVSVFVRVSRTWLTVLGKDPARIPDQAETGNVQPGATWDLVRADARYEGTTEPAAGSQ